MDSWHLTLRRWVVPAALVLGYVCVRALNLWELWMASSSQAATGPPNSDGPRSAYFVDSATPAAPGLSGVLANWDGQWYERIATDGYPRADESRSPNDTWTWAFPPLFPFLVRFVMAISGLGFPVAAVVLNLALGLLAAALLYGMLRDCLPATLAVATALAVNTFVSAPLFTVAYSEPAALVLLLLALSAMLGHRYFLALLWVVLLAFTRPIAVPFALVFAAHATMRWRNRRHEPFRRTELLTLASGVLLCLASPFVWNAVSSQMFGASPTVQEAADDTGVARASSMLSTFEFGWIGGLARMSGAGFALLFLAMVAATLTLTDRAARRLRLPLELRVWGAAYVVFVIVVTPATPGLLRYLLLAAPALVAAHVLPLTWKKRWWGGLMVAVITVAALYSQWLWIRYLYIVDPAPALLPWAP